MKLNNHGLTVGELTIGIAILIVLSFVWTSISQKPESTKTSLFRNIQETSLAQSMSFHI